MRIYAQPTKAKIDLCGAAIGHRAGYLNRLEHSTCPLERMALADRIEAELFVMLATSWYNKDNADCGWQERHHFLAGFALSVEERTVARLGLV